MAVGSAIARAHYKGRDFDGSTMYATRGADLTGIADGKEGTFCAAVRVDGGDGARRTIFGTYNGTTTGFQVEIQANNTFLVFGETSVPAAVLNISSTTAYTASPRILLLLSSWKLDTAGARHLYVNDVSDLTVTTFTDGTIDYTKGQASVGGLQGGLLPFNGCIYAIGFHTVYHDLSNLAVRRRFITAMGKPAKAGGDGSRAFLTRPLLWMPDGKTNYGTGGAFTEAAATTVANSAP